MPARPDTPEPLRSALNQMEAHVQHFKSSLPFTAPEAVDDRYVDLQHGLADTIENLYEEMSK